MYQYLVSDYFGTGEGQTICLLITRAYPKYDRDYIRKPEYNLKTNEYDPGELKHTPQQIAALEFLGLFDEWYAQGLEVLDQDEFIKRYGNLIPETVKNIITHNNKTPGNLHWHMQLHVNYS